MGLHLKQSFEWKASKTDRECQDIPRRPWKERNTRFWKWLYFLC